MGLPSGEEPRRTRVADRRSCRRGSSDRGGPRLLPDSAGWGSDSRVVEFSFAFRECHAHAHTDSYAYADAGSDRVAGATAFRSRDGAPAPGGSASPSPSATTSPSASPSTPNAPSEGATPDPTPLTTPPPVGDPSLEVFRDKVGGWLTAAERGLDIVDENRNQDALPVVDSLQEDAQRLGDAVPPSSIQDAWRSGVETYADRLTALRTALESDSGVSGALDSARSAVAELRSVAGF